MRVGAAPIAAAFCIAVASLPSRAALAAPVSYVKGPYLQALGPTGVTIKVELSAPEAIEVLVTGPGASKRSVAGPGPEPRRFQAVRVDGLEPETTYRYRVVAAGVESDEGRFTTAPRESRPFRFIVYGDSRSDHAAHAGVVRAIEAVPSDFLIHTGDMVHTGSKDVEWQTFFGIERALLRDRCVFAAVGNHELTSPDLAGQVAFLRYFASADDGTGAKDRAVLYGSFRWSNTRFFLLNAMDSWTGEDRRWLAEELSRSQDEPGLVHRIAVLHHGPFSSGPHGGNKRVLAGGVVKLLREGRVGLVFAGHDHAYERGEGEGLKYIVSGGAGAPLYAKKGAAPQTRAFTSAHHFVEVLVDGEAVQTIAHRASGGVIERCAFQGLGAWDCKDEEAGAPAREGAALKVGGASSCGCDFPGAAPRAGGGLTWPMGAALGFLALIARRWGSGRGQAVGGRGPA